MHEKYKNRVQFVLVYLREAHPQGGWEMSDWSVLSDPTSLGARQQVAAECCAKLNFDFSVVADTMDDQVAVQWSGWPERLFVVSRDGRIVHTGDMGPYGFNPSISYPGLSGQKPGCVSLEQFLEAYLTE